MGHRPSGDQAGKERLKSFRDQVAGFLELPGEVVLDVCRVVLVGDMQVLVENHRGLVEYQPDRVTIGVPGGQITLSGQELVIGAVSHDEVIVLGKIEALRFA